MLFRSPFSFLILLAWALSLFFLMSLTKGLSILFIFSKNQLFISLIFAIVFFICNSFISALIFMTSFLLLTLGFVFSSFSSCFWCKDRFFINGRYFKMENQFITVRVEIMITFSEFAIDNSALYFIF